MGWQYGATRALVSRQSSLWVVIKQDYPRGCRRGSLPFRAAAGGGQGDIPLPSTCGVDSPPGIALGSAADACLFSGWQPAKKPAAACAAVAHSGRCEREGAARGHFTGDGVVRRAQPLASGAAAAPHLAARVCAP